jgi:hypothetical protein
MTKRKSKTELVGGPIAAGNDMSITDNGLQTQQEQREAACLIVLNPADIIVGDRRDRDERSADRQRSR